MGAEHGVDRLRKRGRALVIALLHRSVIVVVKRLSAFQRFAQFVRQCVVGGISAGEQSVAAMGRDFDGIQHGCLVRDLGMYHVVVKHHLAVRYGADRFAVFADVGDQHDAFGQRIVSLRVEFLRSGDLARLAEPVCNIELTRCVQVLAAKQQDDVVEPGPIDLGDGFCALILL